MPVDINLLQNVALFDGLPADKRALIVERGRIRAYRPDTTVINQEDTGDTLYVILHGIVKVFLSRADGRDVFLAVLARGEHFGELSLIDSKYRSASVVTQDDTSLLLINRDLFNELTYCREFALNLCRSLAARFRSGNERVGNLARMSVQGLVAHHIHEFAELYGQRSADSPSISIPIRLTQNDLADLVGASRERVNQVIRQFKESGCISVNMQHRITVHNMADLQRCIDLQ